MSLPVFSPAMVGSVLKKKEKEISCLPPDDQISTPSNEETSGSGPGVSNVQHHRHQHHHRQQPFNYHAIMGHSVWRLVCIIVGQF